MSPADPPPAAPVAAPSFQERFAALGREWRAQVPGRLADVQARSAACRLAPGDAAALEELHRMVHTLAGSAGTFGLDELSVRARAMEHEVERLMALPARGAADFDGTERALDALLLAPRD
ncbi:MAG: Hpt domain-containing protein [Ramlibacter sp.]